jgi:hypothetical protein
LNPDNFSPLRGLAFQQQEFAVDQVTGPSPQANSQARYGKNENQKNEKSDTDFKHVRSGFKDFSF